jgi:hypothetical protein
MIKRLDLILNGKGGVGKISYCLLHHLGQPLKTAVGRLVLCKPFLATAAVWLDSAARCCVLRLRFCVCKTCPATGIRQPSVTLRQDTSSDKFRVKLDKQVLDNSGFAGKLLLRRAEKSKPASERMFVSENSPVSIYSFVRASTTPLKWSCAARTVTARGSRTRRLAPFVRWRQRCKDLKNARRGLELDITDANKRIKELGEKVGAKFEREERFQELTRRQSEIEEKLDLTCKRRLKSAAGGARKVLHLPGKADWI